MAYNPVSGIAPQYSDENNQLASDYYLKFYIANTVTPLSMATDSTGSTLLVKCKLNTDGFPISNPLDNTTVFIPHADQSYRLVIYKNEADADANTTANAFVNIPEVETMIASGQLISSDSEITADKLLTTESKWHTAQLGAFMTYGGTANAITLTSVNTTPVTSYIDGMKVRFLPTANNTGAATVNIDGLGAKAIVTVTGVALPADYIYERYTDLTYNLANDYFVANRAIESGSNSNGEHARWEDGTLEMSDYQPGDVAIAANSLAADVWTFPVPFKDTEYYSHSSVNPDNSGDFDGLKYLDNETTTGIDFVFGNGAVAQNFRRRRRYARGKWY